MFNKTLKIILFTCLLIILLSCKEEKKTIAINGEDMNFLNKYFPLSENYMNEYTYRRYRQNVLIEDLGIFKTKVAKEDSLDGKKAYFLNIEDNSGQVLATEMYSLEENKIYFYSNIVNEMVESAGSIFDIDLPFKIGDFWILIADYENQKWQVYENSIDEEPLGENNKVSGKITINCSFVEEKDVNFLNKQVTARKYQLEYNFDGVVDFDYETNFTIIFNITFGENIGLIKTEIEESLIDLKIVEFPFGGIKEEIINYQIK